jgi:hypothetical protein
MPDGLRHRLLRRTASRRSFTHAKEQPMRSRLAILTMLVLGFALSASGTGLAISGISGDGAVSAEVQYGSPKPPGDVLGGHHSGGPKNCGPKPGGPKPCGPKPGGPKPGGPKPGAKAKGSRAGTNTAATRREQDATSSVQSARQIGAGVGAGSLPFTGWAAMPVLVLGLGLLTTGLLLRRRVNRGDAA